MKVRLPRNTADIDWFVTDVGSTARYAHLARGAEKVAVAKVGGSIEADILRPGADAGDDGRPWKEAS